jgi:hypothetical protein
VRISEPAPPGKCSKSNGNVKRSSAIGFLDAQQPYSEARVAAPYQPGVDVTPGASASWVSSLGAVSISSTLQAEYRLHRI